MLFLVMCRACLISVRSREFFRRMWTAIILLLILTIGVHGQVNSQDRDDSLRRAVQEFFFDLPTNVSLDSLARLLSSKKDFKRGWSKSYDQKTTIDGKILQDNNLNPRADYNQLLISVWGNRAETKDTLRFGWYISYGLDELALATKDRDDIKAKFALLFPERSENSQTGYHGELDEYILFRSANKELEIRLTKYERPGNHRLSITYTEIRE